jgi:hypothetical protein
MKINYTRKREGIGITEINSCDNFVVGDSIICMNDNKTLNITKNKTYKALYIYETNKNVFVQIADDGNEICSYEVNRFKSIEEYREDRISKILD